MAKAGTTTTTPSRVAAHGHRWWELDVTYLTLRLMALFGLAWDLVQPNQRGATDINRAANW